MPQCTTNFPTSFIHPYTLRVKKYDNFARAIKPAWQPDSAFATLVHGDAWSNNIMVRGGPNDELPSSLAEVKLIDFGNSYVLHPAYDVIYFLYTCTDRTFRHLHYDALLRKYFETFGTYLSGGDVGGYDEFKKEAEELREGIMLLTLTVRLMGPRMGPT